jgi:predicted DNA-binding antitoxin AbrB/MazE fold protein
MGTPIMGQIIHATFQDGVLKPDVPLPFPSMTRVRLIVEPLTAEAPEGENDTVLSEIQRIWDEIDFDSGGPPPNRDELHDRN